MGFLKKIDTGIGTIGIWEITGLLPELELKCRLPENEITEFQKITSERRKKEFLIVRILLKELLGFFPEIVYEKSGKPKLLGSTLNVSISHSADLVVAFLSEKNIGIDVEKLDRNINKTALRFLNQAEKDFAEKSENPQYSKTILWSAKEAIFKSCREQGIQFNREINVQPFQLVENHLFSGERVIDENKIKYRLWFFFCKNNVVVYCVEG